MTRSLSNDELLWATTLHRVRHELQALPARERAWLVDLSQRIGELQAELDRLFRAGDGPAICAACQGGCCSRAKYHLTLANVLGYLLEGAEPPVPDFSLPCPMLGAHGCRLPVGRRPFNCIIFLCERLDERLVPEQRTAFAGIEAELRNAYHALAERCPGASLRGLLLAAARVGARPLLTNS